MKAGLLNTRITVQHKASVRDAFGADVFEWRPLAQVWADVRHTSGTEGIRGDALLGEVRASVRIRWRADVDASMRILLPDGAAYEITAVLPDMRRRFTDLVCRRLGDAEA